MLPNYIFFTGVPGSMWSAIAQDLESIPGFNSSDRSDTRSYSTGHRGSYYGRGMEFSADIESMSRDEMIAHFNKPWTTLNGPKLIKSHEWAYKLRFLKNQFPDDWIMLIYRPDLPSQGWWHEAGGFTGITYPDYTAYKNSANMLSEIMKQNQAILEFAYEQDATWSHYTPQWVAKHFGEQTLRLVEIQDILVTVIK